MSYMERKGRKEVSLVIHSLNHPPSLLTQVKNRIGKGSFGQVVRGVDRSTGTEVAIKIIKSRYVSFHPPIYPLPTHSSSFEPP